MKTCFGNVLHSVLLSLCVSTASAATLYVDVNSTNATPPFESWSEAAITIQDAVDLSNPGDTVLVADGVYRNGGRLVNGTSTNRVAVTKPITIQSVNGPTVTLIQGCLQPSDTVTNNEVRCVYLASGALLSGFTLTNGVARTASYGGDPAGGVWCESTNATVTNCIFIANANSVVLSGTLKGCIITENNGFGGAIEYSILENCILSRNRGGTASWCSLNNCLVVSNTLPYVSTTGGILSLCSVNNSTVVFNYGGGLYYSWATNSIIYYNGFTNYDDTWYPLDSYNSPVVASCIGTKSFFSENNNNVTNEPGFVDINAGNFQLRTNSYCVNAGSNEWVTVSTDLAGNPRIFGDRVDIGAYELQTPGMTHFQLWLEQNGLSIDGSDDDVDTDHDGMTNREEWRFGTDPREAASVFRVTITPSPPHFFVSWTGPAGTYAIERRGSLGTNAAFEPLFELTYPESGYRIFGDRVETNTFFYRVRLK